jgi:hypothetical protein
MREFPLPALRRSEILRYMGCKSEDGQMAALVNEALALCQGVFTPRVCFSEFEISEKEGSLDLGFAVTHSRDLAKNLCGCKKMILFCATVGHGIDRLTVRHSRLSPSLALCLQSVGAEAIEAVCREFCEYLADEYGSKLRPRFSAGYGDLPLRLQKDIFRALGCEKRIGVTLNESLLMSPTKSVSAIIGIES